MEEIGEKRNVGGGWWWRSNEGIHETDASEFASRSSTGNTHEKKMESKIPSKIHPRQVLTKLLNHNHPSLQC